MRRQKNGREKTYLLCNDSSFIRLLTSQALFLTSHRVIRPVFLLCFSIPINKPLSRYSYQEELSLPGFASFVLLTIKSIYYWIRPVRNQSEFLHWYY